MPARNIPPTTALRRAYFHDIIWRPPVIAKKKIVGAKKTRM